VIVGGEELRRFTTAVEAHLGIRVADRALAMTEVLARRAEHHASVPAYLARVEAADAEELRALVTEVSIGETYFFRHAEQCQAYADVVPSLVAERGHVRVLSAGCSSGEEPYTLAMLARERVDPHAVSIHAFDFNPNALVRATQARYSRWSLRATSEARELRWFVQRGRDVELVPEIKRAVAFHEANLLSDGAWTREHWDLIFCRNVIMYFSEARAEAAVRRLVGALAPGGYLFLGHAETLRERPAELELCHSHGTFYYRRGGTPAPAIQVTPLAPVARTVWHEDIASATARVHALADRAFTPERPADPRELASLKTLLGEERFAEATEALARLPEAIARGGEARLYTAIVQAHTGAGALAEEACRSLLADDPREARAHYLLALCRGGAGDAIGSEHHAREALTLEPRFAMAAVQLAFVLRRANARAAAIDQLVRAIALIELEDEGRFALFAGGFSRTALVALCKSELAALGVAA